MMIDSVRPDLFEQHPASLESDLRLASPKQPASKARAHGIQSIQDMQQLDERLQLADYERGLNANNDFELEHIHERVSDGDYSDYEDDYIDEEEEILQRSAMEFAAKLKQLEERHKGSAKSTQKSRADPAAASEPMFPGALPASSPG